MRLGQNLEGVDAMSAGQTAEFHEHIRGHRVVGQFCAQRAARKKPARIPCKRLMTRVYRDGADAMRSWGAEIGGIMRQMASTKRSRRSVANRLQIENVDLCVPVGTMLSLSRVDVAAMTDKGIQSQSDVVAHTSACDSLFFEVVDKWPVRKKQIRTAGQELQDLIKHVLVQLWECSAQSASPTCSWSTVGAQSWSTSWRLCLGHYSGPGFGAGPGNKMARPWGCR